MFHFNATSKSIQTPYTTSKSIQTPLPWGGAGGGFLGVGSWGWVLGGSWGWAVGVFGPLLIDYLDLLTHTLFVNQLEDLGNELGRHVAEGTLCATLREDFVVA